MTSSSASHPNADQIRYWNQIGGKQWLNAHEGLRRQLLPLGLEVIERAGIEPGSRVLDVGCGCGDTSFELGRRVGPRGMVTGLDISQVLLSRALELAYEEGVSNVAFTRADAQTAALPEGAFDLLFSRFGVMFFADPEAAFRNMRRALRPGARMMFICWRDIRLNPIMLTPALAVSGLVPLPAFDPSAPGPFAFADRDRVRGFLERAGFLDVAFEELDRDLSVGHDASLDETAMFLTHIGPAYRALVDAGAGPDLWAAATAAIREKIAPYHRPEGVRMPSATWLVTGRAPG
ncbi:MAG: class I SAM-dependent methyltransferase [Byssovorax sp.]